MKCDAPDEVRAVKMALRAASDRATSARRYWTSVRAATVQRIDPATGRYTAEANSDDDHIAHVGAATMAMWASEASLAKAAETWRTCLDARKRLPASERWDLAALERWAKAQP